MDIVESRFVGMKSRGVYETPGGTVRGMLRWTWCNARVSMAALASAWHVTHSSAANKSGLVAGVTATNSADCALPHALRSVTMHAPHHALGDTSLNAAQPFHLLSARPARGRC